MKKFKTLNNWVARAFVTEYCNGNLEACVHLYENCYQLMEQCCWKRLLLIFFSDLTSVEILSQSLKQHHKHVLLLNLDLMYRDYYGIDD